jgi:copper(I)-binding protein
MKRSFAVAILFLTLVLAACTTPPAASSSNIEIVSPYISAVTAMEQMGNTPASPDSGMPSMGGRNGAAYMVIKNSGSAPDKLLKARCDVANSVELHQTEMKDNVMAMHPVESLDVPANGQVELKPGGYHIMLIGLKQGLKAGDKPTLTLAFEKAGTITIEAEVRNP